MSRPLVHGELRDYLTGTQRPDTDDERYRQALARRLVARCGYVPREITPRLPVPIRAGTVMTTAVLDYVVRIAGHPAMVVQFAPGSLVSRHRQVLALSRLVAGRVLPVVVVSNGRDADILEGRRGTVIGRGLDAIPEREELARIVQSHDFTPLPPRRLTLESRIASAFSCIEETCTIAR